jgi:Ni,Fe-hydrogenase III large subunit/Ni,Fe-hydrogenase III component G
MDSLQSLHEYFKKQSAFEVVRWTESEGVVWLTAESLPEVMEELWLNPKNRPVLLTHIGNDERELGHGFVIYLVLHFPGDFTLTLGARGIKEGFPTLSALCPALNWPEREVQDLFGLVAEGHPDPRPLVLHPGWTEGFYPLRKQSEDLKSFNPQPLIFNSAQGEGTFEIPVGPIHAGIIEPGHFRFQTVGETILHIDAQLFFTHKGIEKLLEGKSIEEGLKIIERVCGVCTVSHSLAYCEAVEKLAHIGLSREALRWRTVLAELERLYNHVGDIGNLCAGVGFALGNANGLQNKEQLQRLNKEIFGHRFLRGAVIPGGVKVQPTAEQIGYLRERLQELHTDFEKWIPLILEHDGFRQRAVTTGVLKNQSALDLGVTGPAARASGVAVDWRERHAYLLYPELQIEPQVEMSGDVWARLMVRVREVRQSFGLLDTLLSGEGKAGDFGESGVSKQCVGKDNVSAACLSYSGIEPYSFAWGCAESPRGTDVIWLMTDKEGKIFRCRIRSASYANWPAVPLAVLGNIVPDFPLINKSFELCYSCCDR